MPPPLDTPVPSSPRVPHAPLRVVFFGPPFSGKSALMKAFGDIASAAAEEEPVELSVGPQPADASGRDVIRRVVSVDLPDSDDSTPSLTLTDCDGHAAGNLLRDATALTRPRIRTALLDALRSAEALVVTVDATDTDREIEEQLSDLKVFLQALQQGRTFVREVGGLPVFVTLTKCDRLYRPGQTPDQWTAAIVRRTAEVQGQFEDALGERTEDAPFGEIALRLAATATAVPPPKPFEYSADANGAFQTNRLLREVLAAASDYRDRQRQGKKRLNWTVSAALGLLGLMLAAFVGFALTGEPGPVDALILRARQVQEREGPPEIRLADRNFTRNKKTLDDLRASPYFDLLGADIKRWAADREREYTEYAEYRKRFQPPQFSPAEVRTASELTKLTVDLVDVLAPPVDYAEAWAKTEAVLLWKKWSIDRDLLTKSEEETHDWYRSLITRASRLLVMEVDGAPWREKASALLVDARNPPVKPADPIPGSPSVPVRRGQPLTYAAAFDFERSDLARQDWEFVARKVDDLRDLADALGLTTDPAAPSAPLDLTEPTGDPAASLALATERWQAIRSRFPRTADGTASWAASNFPDPVRQQLTRRSRTAADTALRHVRRLIVAELKANGPADTAADWLKLADGLLATPAFQDWSRLVQLLLKCADVERPTAGLPVTELAKFVKKTSFEWSPTAVEIFLPTELLTGKYDPAGRFAIIVTPDRGAPRVTAFGPAVVAEREKHGVRYRFPMEAGTTPLVYRPGEGLTAELPIKAGAATYKLKWTVGGTATYQFDKLTREPVLEPVAGGVPFPATGVKLTWTPAKEAVTVPELLPALK